MKSRIILFLIFVWMLKPVSPLDAEEFKFVMTGHNWNVIGRSYEGKVDPEGLNVLIKVAKLYYLKGVYMGINSEVMTRFQQYLLIEVSDEELLAYMDLFYSDPKNLDIPVPYAVRIIAKDVYGAPDDNVHDKLEYLRKSFGAISGQLKETGVDERADSSVSLEGEK